MKAMILAAGRGERMRPLTDHTPKPLLLVGGRPLIEYHLHRLALAGVSEVVINTAHLGDQIQERLGDVFNVSDTELIKRDNKEYSLSITYSKELAALETAGAILHALPLLGDEPFLLINGDVWTDYPYQSLLSRFSSIATSVNSQSLSHVVLVKNPEHNVSGDFSISAEKSVDKSLAEAFLNEKHESANAYTFSGISVINPKLLMAYPDKREKFPLLEILHFGISRQQITAEVYRGQWRDIGTIERLQSLDDDLKSQQ